MFVKNGHVGTVHMFLANLKKFSFAIIANKSKVQDHISQLTVVWLIVFITVA